MHGVDAGTIELKKRKRTGPRSRALAGLLSWASLPWLVVAAGVGLRIERFIDNRSLWLDESLLALNLMEKSAHDLVRSLDYTQSAPAGFLLIEKAAVDLLGESEQALRLFPFLASLVGLLLFALVVRRLLPRGPALLALTLYAVNEPLLFQSSETKPYSSDATVAILIVWLTLRALDAEPPVGVRAVLPLALVGTAAVWLSYPSVFVLAGAGLALAVRAGTGNLRRSLWTLGAVAAAWLTSFLVEYAVTSRNISSVSESIFAGESDSTSKVAGVVRSAWTTLWDPGGFLPSTRSVAAVCLFAGVIVLLSSRRRDRLTLLVLPGVLAVVAALIDRYPLGGRFSIFLVPFLLIVIALGTLELVRTSRRPWLLGLPLVILLVVSPLVRAARSVASPSTREEVRPLVALLAREWQPGDTLYVYQNAQYALRYYDECRDCDVARLPVRLARAPRRPTSPGFPAALASTPPQVIVGTSQATPVAKLKQLTDLRGRRRVWLLFSHVTTSDEGVFTTYLDTLGRRTFSKLEPGASLYRYDLSG